MARTTAEAHKRIDAIESKLANLDTRIVSMEKEISIQFKDLFGRVKRIESVLIAATGSIILMLIAVLMKM